MRLSMEPDRVGAEQVEGRLSHEVGLVGKGKEPVARVKGCPGEIKALVLERHSGMSLSKWRLNLEKWQKPRVEAAWSEELGNGGSCLCLAWWVGSSRHHFANLTR